MATYMKLKRPLARLEAHQRAQAVEVFAGRVCRVTYRHGGYTTERHDMVGRVVGASYHVTNGNSTGDLIIRPAGAHDVWGGGALGQTTCRSIALVHVLDIEEVGP